MKCLQLILGSFDLICWFLGAACESGAAIHRSTRRTRRRTASRVVNNVKSLTAESTTTWLLTQSSESLCTNKIIPFIYPGGGRGWIIADARNTKGHEKTTHLRHSADSLCIFRGWWKLQQRAAWCCSLEAWYTVCVCLVNNTTDSLDACCVVWRLDNMAPSRPLTGNHPVAKWK